VTREVQQSARKGRPRLADHEQDIRTADHRRQEAHAAPYLVATLCDDATYERARSCLDSINDRYSSLRYAASELRTMERTGAYALVVLRAFLSEARIPTSVLRTACLGDAKRVSRAP
jgi:hypothetical protein